MINIRTKFLSFDNDQEDFEHCTDDNLTFIANCSFSGYSVEYAHSFIDMSYWTQNQKDGKARAPFQRKFDQT